MWVLFIPTRARGKCPVPKRNSACTREANSTDVPDLPSCLGEGLGACPHTQLPLQGPCWLHRDHSHPSSGGKDHLSSYPHTFPAVILISRSNWRSSPHLLMCSIASCHIPWMGTRSAWECWWQQCSCDTNFSQTNLCMWGMYHKYLNSTNWGEQNQGLHWKMGAIPVLLTYSYEIWAEGKL